MSISTQSIQLPEKCIQVITEDISQKKYYYLAQNYYQTPHKKIHKSSQSMDMLQKAEKIQSFQTIDTSNNNSRLFSQYTLNTQTGHSEIIHQKQINLRQTKRGNSEKYLSHYLDESNSIINKSQCSHIFSQHLNDSLANNNLSISKEISSNQCKDVTQIQDKLIKQINSNQSLQKAIIEKKMFPSLKNEKYTILKNIFAHKGNNQFIMLKQQNGSLQKDKPLSVPNQCNTVEKDQKNNVRQELIDKEITIQIKDKIKHICFPKISKKFKDSTIVRDYNTLIGIIENELRQNSKMEPTEMFSPLKRKTENSIIRSSNLIKLGIPQQQSPKYSNKQEQLTTLLTNVDSLIPLINQQLDMNEIYEKMRQIKFQLMIMRAISLFLQFCYIISVISHASGDLEMAIQNWKDALKYCNHYQIFCYKLIPYKFLALLYKDKKEFFKSLCQIKKLLKYSWLYQQQDTESFCYEQISLLSYYMCNIENAKYFHERAISGIFEEQSSPIREYGEAKCLQDQINQGQSLLDNSLEEDDFDLEIFKNKDFLVWKQKNEMFQKQQKEKLLALQQKTIINSEKQSNQQLIVESNQNNEEESEQNQSDIDHKDSENAKKEDNSNNVQPKPQSEHKRNQNTNKKDSNQARGSDDMNSEKFILEKIRNDIAKQKAQPAKSIQDNALTIQINNILKNAQSVYNRKPQPNIDKNNTMTIKQKQFLVDVQKNKPILAHLSNNRNLKNYTNVECIVYGDFFRTNNLAWSQQVHNDIMQILIQFQKNVKNKLSQFF